MHCTRSADITQIQAIVDSKNAIKISFCSSSFVFFFRDALQAEKYFFNLAEHQTGLFVLDI